MSSESLDKSYDTILTGNDMTSSLVAAAASRIGKKVLLVDYFDKGPRRFPREWSSIKLFELLCSEVLLNQTLDSDQESVKDGKITLKCQPSWKLSNARVYHSRLFGDKEKLKQFLEKNMRNQGKLDAFVDRFCDYYFPSLKATKTALEADAFLSELREEFPYFNSFSNNFTMDLTPRILQANGSLTDLLIKSNITRYLTFQKVARLLTFVKQKDDNYKLMNVPCTRSDVFNNKEINLKEKRLLMKLLQHMNDFEKEPEKFEDVENVPFSQFIDEFFEKLDQKMPEIVDKILLNAVLMCDQQFKTGDALRRFSKFMKAIGRFTDRPYLVTDYGTDDIVQAFCRYSSVYGGIYCLDTKMNNVEINPETGRVVAVVLDVHGRVECEHLVSDYKFHHLKCSNSLSEVQRMSRAITCSSNSILEYGENECLISFLYIPESISGTVPVYVYETNVATHSCTSGLHVQYYWSDSKHETAENDMKGVVEMLFGAELEELFADDRLLWCLFYNQNSQKDLYDSCPANLHIVSPPINEIDYESVVEEAKRIFEQMFPGEEFFPQTKEPTGCDDEEGDDS